MKKIYLLALSFFSLSAIAQTIVQSDMPFAGLAWTSGTDTTYSAAIPAGGAGQNWNYSGLQYDYVDTSGFGNSAGTPYATSYPSANLAAHKISTDEWTYFTSASTGFYVNGFVSPGAAPFVLNPPQMYVPVPFSFGDTHTDISRIVIDTTFSTFAAQIIINFHGDFVADGNGSLTTPTATYPSTLRVKQTMLETDSLMVDYLGNGNYSLLGSQQSQHTYYRWFQHGGTANYILGIDADSLGTTATRSDYVIQWGVLGTNEIALSKDINLYPNPSSDKVTIVTTKNNFEELDVYNQLGSKVFSGNSQDLSAGQLNNRNRMDLDVSEWPAGIYFYSVTSGEKLVRGKFSVVH